MTEFTLPHTLEGLLSWRANLTQDPRKMVFHTEPGGPICTISFSAPFLDWLRERGHSGDVSCYNDQEHIAFDGIKVVKWPEYTYTVKIEDPDLALLFKLTWL